MLAMFAPQAVKLWIRLMNVYNLQPGCVEPLTPYSLSNVSSHQSIKDCCFLFAAGLLQQVHLFITSIWRKRETALMIFSCSCSGWIEQNKSCVKWWFSSVSMSPNSMTLLFRRYQVLITNILVDFLTRLQDLPWWIIFHVYPVIFLVKTLSRVH